MHTTTRTPIFRSYAKTDAIHKAVLLELAEELELERITLLSSTVSHHPHKRIHIRIDHLDTIDCEGDSVPMTVTKVLTDHYTQTTIYQGGNIITL